ncbi:hypothetical protein P879_08208 [Paragonimus westermani]|uniref:Tetratricopeptide repeat protein 37 n=1 Tax=Paragonimus westermani TaxID=34504 RepID=A0A8T0DM06_9TREM|nr:hypothetical protein P879_08208 [Paragonimus westermani]
MDQIHFSKLMWLNYGLIAMRLKRSALCVAALQKVVILDSKNALYWELLGEAYLLRGSCETALKALQRSILLDPTRSLAHIRFGQASRRLGDFELANKHFTIGLNYARSQEQAKSISHEVTILALKELVEINLLLSRTHLREGMSGRAVEEFQFVMKYLDQAFELSSSVGRSPLWAYHYTASAFSLFSVIDDSDFCMHLPRRFSSVLRLPAEQSMTENEMATHMCPYTCLQLAGVYLACTYQRWLSTPKSQSTENQPGSSVISRGILLISLGLHCLSYAQCLLKHKQSTKTTSAALLNANQLFLMAESALKRSLSALTEKAAKDQCFLDERQSEEIVAEVRKIAQVEASPEEFARERLAVNRTLRAKAWYGLTVLYSTVEGDFSEHVDYCLCQALLARPDTTEAGVSLAVRMLHLGRTQFASSLIAHFQASDPDNYVVWLACAHLNAVTGVSETQPCHAMKPWTCSNNTVVKNLLQAACLGANVPVALHLADNLFPLLIDAVSRPIYGESNITSSDHSKETYTFIRLAMEVATEALNRALAYEPQNPRLWHNRGLLLQLAGLSAPAEFCLRKAYNLFADLTPSAHSLSDLQLACSQCFLITCVRGKPDWTLANRLVSLSEGCNPAACASVAEALSKGLIYLHHPELSELTNSASTCLIDELLRLAQQGVAAAIAVTLAFPNIGRWLLVLHHFNHSGPHDLLLSQLFELLSSGSPVSPQLACSISSLVVRLLEQFPDLDKNAVAYLQHFCHSQLQNIHQVPRHVEDGFTGHNLYEHGRLSPTELSSWAVDVAMLVNLTSGQAPSGMAYLSKFVACQPDDPNRWVALASWLVDHYYSETSDNLVLSDRSKKKNRKNFCVWKTLAHVLQVALVLQSGTPINSFFANTLTRCARCWLAVSRTSTLTETVVPVLLKGLRRAAALFPNTPDLLTQLMLFTEHH